METRVNDLAPEKWPGDPTSRDAPIIFGEVVFVHKDTCIYSGSLKLVVVYFSADTGHVLQKV